MFLPRLLFLVLLCLKTLKHCVKAQFVPLCDHFLPFLGILQWRQRRRRCSSVRRSKWRPSSLNKNQCTSMRWSNSFYLLPFNRNTAVFKLLEFQIHLLLSCRVSWLRLCCALAGQNGSAPADDPECRSHWQPVGQCWATAVGRWAEAGWEEQSNFAVSHVTLLRLASRQAPAIKWVPSLTRSWRI